MISARRASRNHPESEGSRIGNPFGTVCAIEPDRTRISRRSRGSGVPLAVSDSRGSASTPAPPDHGDWEALRQRAWRCSRNAEAALHRAALDLVGDDCGRGGRRDGCSRERHPFTMGRCRRVPPGPGLVPGRGGTLDRCRAAWSPGRAGEDPRPGAFDARRAGHPGGDVSDLVVAAGNVAATGPDRIRGAADGLGRVSGSEFRDPPARVPILKSAQRARAMVGRGERPGAALAFPVDGVREARGSLPVPAGAAGREIPVGVCDGVGRRDALVRDQQRRGVRGFLAGPRDATAAPVPDQGRFRTAERGGVDSSRRGARRNPGLREQFVPISHRARRRLDCLARRRPPPRRLGAMAATGVLLRGCERGGSADARRHRPQGEPVDLLRGDPALPPRPVQRAAAAYPRERRPLARSHRG